MSKPSLADLEALRKELCDPTLDQSHLFESWPSNPASYSLQQIGFLKELYDFQKMYPGGVQQYVRNGKSLLDIESDEVGFTELDMPPLLFDAPLLYRRTPELTALETVGTAMVAKTVFVLVAGGLGERLGSSDIKIGLPVETATDTTYLDYYLSWAREVGGPSVPFVIMTSDDTHRKTLLLLKLLNVEMPNLRVLKQEQVFCFADSAAHVAVDQYGKLLRKPHGHGDVHTLISNASVTDGIVEDTQPGHVTGAPHTTATTAAAIASYGAAKESLVQSWRKAGYESIAFFQDTNAVAIYTIPVSLAMSEKHNLDMNFTCIPRLPRETIGLLCRVKKDDDEPWRVANVEYNIFSEAARTLTKEGGDIASATSPYSPFPGSINTLVYNLESYATVLEASHGAVPEFINPKFSDTTRRNFTKPARIESMMQDMALLFSADEYRVGGTVFERFTYQPVKNSMEGAVALVRQRNAAYCAATAEADFYELQRRRLRAVGVPLVYNAQPEMAVAEGVIPIHLFPTIVLDAQCRGNGTLAALAHVFPKPDLIDIDARSALTVEGRVIIESLHLRGALIIRGPKDSSAEPFVVRDVSVLNAGWHARALSMPCVGDDALLGEVDRIRGFVLEKAATAVLDYATGTVRSEDSPTGSDTAKL